MTEILQRLWNHYCKPIQRTEGKDGYNKEIDIKSQRNWSSTVSGKKRD